MFGGVRKKPYLCNVKMKQGMDKRFIIVGFFGGHRSYAPIRKHACMVFQQTRKVI